jgi:hypothetical protein
MPFAELLALCLDGQLFRVGDAFASPDTPDCPALRAQAFGSTAPGWAVADRGTAAWIHGTRSSPPPLPQVCVPPRHRGSVLTPNLDACHRSLAAEETVDFDGVRATTPLRTALDLLCTSGPFGEGDALEVRHLLLLAGVTPAEADERLRLSRRKGCALGRRRLPAVARAALPGGAAQPPLTRYTS